jgi:hypothetical protein
MSIGAIANILGTTVPSPTFPETAGSRPEPDAHDTGQAGSPPPADGRQPATVTTLSAAALALQVTADQAARDAAAAASVSDLTSVVFRDWAPGAPTDADGAVQDALNALTEASRENLQAAIAGALTTLQDQAAVQQKAIDDTRAMADKEKDATALFALNAEIRLAYGALPSPVTGDPVLREPGQVDVIA